jgi:cob(I)alamin adenosyltransferase
MLSSAHLQKDFDNLAREDAFFDDYFKHVSGKPVQYLDRLEDLLFENPRQLITICQGIPDNVSYFVNRICCYFINNLGIERQFRKEVFNYLNRLINMALLSIVCKWYNKDTENGRQVWTST